MTVAYSTLLTNLDLGTRKLGDPSAIDGGLKIASATIELATADIDNTDVIHMVEIPSNAIVHSIMIFNDDLDSNATALLAANVGLYAGQRIVSSVTTSSATITNADTTTYTAYRPRVWEKDEVIDADCYATAITCLRDANDQGFEVAYEVKDIANIGNEAWQDAGLAEDPHAQLRLSLTISAAAGTAAAGTLSIRVIYA